ncbi:natriuretic peptides B [Alosa pseudoharengus]|uniref:natriuretic peptides B n=1 Tax=Alosa pseudoharengus TaxID=34774 RepID=UPI003F8C16B6
MQLFNIPITLLLAFLNLHLLSGHPVVPSELLSSEDVDILKVLLRQLEDSIPEQRPAATDGESAQNDAEVPLEDMSLPEEEDYTQAQSAQHPRLSLADVKEFLSARDLKAVRNDSKRYSACFGRRMDRIGSMTSLGCNTVGRKNRRR